MDSSNIVKNFETLIALYLYIVYKERRKLVLDVQLMWKPEGHVRNLTNKWIKTILQSNTCRVNFSFKKATKNKQSYTPHLSIIERSQMFFKP